MIPPDPAVSARTASAHPPSSFSFIAEVHGTQVHVRINAAVLKSILESIDRSGASAAWEIGFLVGNLGHTNGELLTVEDLKPCRPDSDSDRASLRETIQKASERWRPLPGKKTYQVGCYRIESGTSRHPSKVEVSDASHMLSGSPEIFLLIRPNLGEALVFVSKDRLIQEDTPFKILPLDTLLEAPIAPAGAALPEPPSVRMRELPLPEVGAAAFTRVSSPKAASGRSPWLFAAVAAMVCVLLLVGWMYTAGRLSPANSVAANDLKLQASVENSGALRIVWNQDSIAVKGAQNGAITVTDGQKIRLIPLESSELRTGSILYVPRSDDVKIEMEVNIEGNITYRSSTHVLNGSRSALPSNALPPPKDDPAPPALPAPAASVANVTDRPQKASGKPAVPVVAPEPQPAVQIKAPASVPAPAIARSVQPPPDRPADPAAVSAPTLHPQAVDLARGGPPVPLTSPAPASAPVAAIVPPRATVTEAPTEPAKLLARSPVVMSDEVRRQISGVLKVGLRITVDDHGNVTKVERLSPVQGVSAQLAHLIFNASSDAAKTWKYEPARRDGRALPGTLDLTLEYNRPSRR